MMQALLIGLVKGYRMFLSPWQALQNHGAAAGSYLTITRLARCHPWCEGGSDPVPAEKPRLFSRLISTPTEKKPS